MAFHKLSPAQFNTGWVLCQLGRAYYEMVDYPAAANVFEFARQADRHRLEVCLPAASLIQFGVQTLFCLLLGTWICALRHPVM